MDKKTFASYKFKPSDVIEGLNRYFAETKANRYLRASLEIKNGEVKPGNYYVFRNIVFDVNVPKIKECGYGYVLCDPEEVVGVAINWLREEHDIFYTPGMEAPREDRDIFCMENLKETKNFSITIDDFCVDEATKEYEKATRKDVVSVAKVREALGIAEDSDIFQCIKYRNHQLETLRMEVAIARGRYRRAIEERNQFGERLADIRNAAGMSDLDPTDLVEYIKDLAKSRRETLDDWFGEHATVLGLKSRIFEIYREIFDCSDGDPEGTDAELLQDILTEYKRTLELKNVAEEKTIKWKELALENEDKANKYKVRLGNTERQLRWTEEVSRKRLEECEKLKSELNVMTKRYGGSVMTSGGLCEDLTKEREKVKRLEQKLSEIQDICER